MPFDRLKLKSYLKMFANVLFGDISLFLADFKAEYRFSGFFKVFLTRVETINLTITTCLRKDDVITHVIYDDLI